MSTPTERFQIEMHGTVCIVTPSHDMESLQWETVEPAASLVLEPALKQATPQVIFDLSRINFFGSVFLSLLLRCWRQVDNQGGRMVICGTGENARELLRVTALDTLWTIYPTRAEALEALGTSQ